MPWGGLPSKMANFGAWRSLAARLFWEQQVAGSNPVAPTFTVSSLQRDENRSRVLQCHPIYKIDNRSEGRASRGVPAIGAPCSRFSRAETQGKKRDAILADIVMGACHRVGRLLLDFHQCLSTRTTDGMVPTNDLRWISYDLPSRPCRMTCLLSE